MEASGFDWDKARGIPLPEYDWKNGNPEEFYRTFVERPHPVILRGFLKGRDSMEFSFDNMMSRFGEETVALTDTSQNNKGYLGKLKEVEDPNIYLIQSEVLFNRYPKLWKMLETERLEPYLKKKATFSQFFVGKGGTGSTLHAAFAWNFFYMVDGVKRWYFIDPHDYYLAYPMLGIGYVTTGFFTSYPGKYSEDMPAFKYCPYFEADLQPGDVLMNPAWWGHGIKNVTDKSVGIATRWNVNGVYGSTLTNGEEDYDINRFSSLSSMLGFSSIQKMQNILYEPCPTFDEHMSLREIYLTREVVIKFTRLMKGELTVDGWKPIF